MAERIGFELVHVPDLPHSARSVTDLENGRIYLPPASIPGGHGLRGMALQAMAHRLLEHERARELRRLPAAAARDQLLRGRRADAAQAGRRVPAAGEGRPQHRGRGLPRRVRRDPRGGGAALHQPRDDAPRHHAALPAGRRRRRGREGLRERRAAIAGGCHGLDRGPVRVSQVGGPHRVRPAEPHDGVLPVHRHAGGHVLRVDADRHHRQRGVLDHDRRAVRARQVVPRPGDDEPARPPPAPTSHAAAARSPRCRSAGTARRGRVRSCTRTSCRRCRRAPSPAWTTGSCTSSSRVTLASD